MARAEHIEEQANDWLELADLAGTTVLFVDRSSMRARATTSPEEASPDFVDGGMSRSEQCRVNVCRADAPVFATLKKGERVTIDGDNGVWRIAEKRDNPRNPFYMLILRKD